MGSTSRSARINDGLPTSFDESGTAGLGLLFQARARVPVQRPGADEMPQWLSGRLIDAEIRQATHLLQASENDHPITLIGTPQLCQRYRCLLYTSPSPRDQRGSRMPSSA